MVCPLVIRFISSLTPSHKSTLWDTDLGSKKMPGEMTGFFIWVRKRVRRMLAEGSNGH